MLIKVSVNESTSLGPASPDSLKALPAVSSHFVTPEHCPYRDWSRQCTKRAIFSAQRGDYKLGV